MKNNIIVKIFKSKKVCMTIILLILFYTVSTFITQQKKLSELSSQKNFYKSKISSLKDEQEELKDKKSKVNSPEFVEEQAREKLDMYYPNEKVYVVQGK